jgi:hypothetical protein
VVELQQALPRARILYCSATGVTDLENMAYMERLGLWGVTEHTMYFSIPSICRWFWAWLLLIGRMLLVHFSA